VFTVALALATLDTGAAAEPGRAYVGREAVEDAPVLEGPSLRIEGATVLTATGERYDSGVVVVEDGRIAFVGASGGPDAEVTIDAKGAFLTPGLIDTHSHLGVYPSPGLKAHADGNEMVRPTTPDAWAEHALWPQDPGIRRAVAGGITAMQVLPGSGNLIGGRGLVIRPLPMRGSRAMRFPGAPETINMACGENPKRVYGDKGGPMTRMGNLAGQRKAYIEAEAYLRRWQRYTESEGRRKKGEPGKPPDRSIAMDTLAGVLEGDVLPQVHCYRADDMLNILQLAEEFGFEIRSFHHAVEAYKIRDILAERQVSVSTWSDWWGFKVEAYDAVLPNAAMVADAGGIAIIHSDSAVGIQRLNQEASKAWHDGLEAGFDLSEDEALRWITHNPAWALGIEDQTGTLEVGKRADLVLWDTHPFSVYARAQHVFIDGVEVYDHETPVEWSDFEIGQGVTR
jgi:imidazolonepropionase-like amidohydrolase